MLVSNVQGLMKRKEAAAEGKRNPGLECSKNNKNVKEEAVKKGYTSVIVKKGKRKSVEEGTG